jgi:hypothetical protein
VASFTPRQLYSQENSPWYPLDRRLGGPQSRSGRDDEEKNSQPPTGIEPQNPDHLARSPALYRLSYHGSFLWKTNVHHYVHKGPPSVLILSYYIHSTPSHFTRFTFVLTLSSNSEPIQGATTSCVTKIVPTNRIIICDFRFYVEKKSCAGFYSAPLLVRHLDHNTRKYNC